MSRSTRWRIGPARSAGACTSLPLLALGACVGISLAGCGGANDIDPGPTAIAQLQRIERIVVATGPIEPENEVARGVVGERRNEIGLRKAVGATRRAIFLQFLAEATAVCAIAGLVGATLGVGFTRLVAASLPQDSPMQAVAVLDPATVATISLSLVLVGIVAGIVPAVRASQVDPSDALRAT
jgi:hypothetical protein